MLHIHRAERADGLAAALAQLLSEPLGDPLAAELVAVPTRGMERWLAQQLSGRLGTCAGRGDGICAGVAFPSPRRVIADALSAASGVNPDVDPWAPERSAWPLLDVVDEHIGQPWLRSLAGYLGHGDDRPDPVRAGRRLATVRHLAQLYDRYGRHRPDMVNAWAAGEDTDGEGQPLGEAARWQAELWRLLRERIGHDGPAQRLEPACARLAQDPALAQLPPRLSLFGLTRLPAGELRVLRALAAARDVHLFLLHPSPVLWRALEGMQAERAQDGGKTSHPETAVRRRWDPSAQAPRHPLLASWGRDAREMQIVLSAGARHADHHHALRLAPRTVLERLQAGVVSDTPPPGPPPPGRPDGRAPLDAYDDSVQVHACHGRARQVEVLRDAVLQMLAADPSLEPRDVIVMCPDIETFAPLIHATFGSGDAAGQGTASHTDLDLRVRLADRSVRQTNPLLASVADLLELVGGRVTASQVLDFADREPVRRRFGLRDDDFSRLQRWIADAGVRWGLDAAHRAPYKLSGVVSGTWQSGLDRLLLGVAMTEDGSPLVAGVLPLDDVEGAAIDLAGRFAEFIDRLGHALGELSEPKPMQAWARALAAAADALTRCAPAEGWQRSELQRILDELVAEARPSKSDVPAPRLALAEVRGLLSERLAGRPTRANFRTGHLTVCTLYPMRSVPHRVVCLLGLDDGAFPRKSPRDGDDLMLADPRVGERDPRSEDRQLLLDALLAATEHLVVTYTGNDERTNLPRPPAVPVGELLDAIDETMRTDTGRARDRVVVRHPLQPFDARNFTPGALVRERSWSFDDVMLAGARALEAPRAAPERFLDVPLEPVDATVIDLEDLVRFVQHPVRAFLRRRLTIYLDEIQDEVDDALPIELEGLERWGIGQRLLDAVVVGTDGRSACLAEIARGTLPPGALGEPVLRKLYPVVQAIRSAADALAPADAAPAPLDVRVTLPDGRLLSGTVATRGGDLLLTTTFSRVAAKHRLSAWVRLLAATASAPHLALSAATVGRGGGDADVTAVCIDPLAVDPAIRRQRALAHLATVVDLYDRGMREPLPVFCRSSAAFAAAALAGEDPVAAAREQWRSRFAFSGEDQELEHRLAYGGTRPFDALLDEPPAMDERGRGWHEEESSRFGRLARRLWEGLLACERVRSG